MRTLTKTGIRILSAKYRSILIKCAIINASVFIGAFGASSAFADDVYVSSWMGLQGAVAGDANPIYVNGNITRGASDGDITISRTLSIIGTETGKYLSGADTYKGLAIASDTKLNLENITMQNFKSTADGSAIYNKGNLIINGSTFTGNTATDNGGAIYNNGEIYIKDSTFTGNAAKTGGAIYNTNGAKTNIIADDRDITFNGNYLTSEFGQSGAIYNDQGTVGLYADDGKNITFAGGANDTTNNKYGIDGIMNDDILNINGDDTGTTYTGTVNLYTVYTENITGETNIYGGTVGIKDYFEQGTLDVKNGATLDLAKGQINQVIAGTLNIEDGAKLKLDVGNNQIDSLSYMYDNSAITVAVNEINLIGDIDAGILTWLSDTGGTFTDKTTGSFAGATKNAVYTFTKSSNGVLNVDKNTDTPLSLPDIIQSHSEISSYALTDGNETMTAALGTLSGDGRDFTINGNGHALNGHTVDTTVPENPVDKYVAGITVQTGQTLTLNNVSMQNFNNTSAGGAISNGDTLNKGGTITDITGNFSENSAQNGGAIYNRAGVIGSITSIFEKNSATTNGGAIYNFKQEIGGTIDSLTGNFIKNSAVAGGAIYNLSGGEIGNITGDFEGNFATNSGGAINNGAKIGNITGNFKGNHADSTGGMGGAIYNNGTIENITGDFENNYTKSTTMGGGAIANTGTINISTSDEKPTILFKGNYITNPTGKGGAIWNKAGTVGLYAKTINDSITFVGGIETDDMKDIDGIFNETYSTSTITREGVLNINGNGINETYAGTVNLYNVDGTGTTNIYGGKVNVAKDLTQKTVSIAENATLTTKGNVTTTSGITNAGTLNLLGGTSTTKAIIASTVSGDGTTNFGNGSNAYIQVDRAIIQAINIKANADVLANADMGAEGKAFNILNNGNLTINAGNIKADVANSGTLNLGAGTLDKAITGGGSIVTTGNVASNANLLGNAVTNDSNTLTLTGGQLAKTVTGGNVTIAGDVNSNASIESAIAINATKSLSISADNVDGAVTNAGTLNLGAGTLAQAITGTGTITTTGDVSSNANYLGNMVINDYHTLTLTGDATTGVLSKLISGGEVVINGTINSSELIGASITINPEKSLEIAPSKLCDETYQVNNSGTLKLSEGTLTRIITGNGVIVTQGDITSNAFYLGNDVTNTGHTLTLTGAMTGDAPTGALSKSITGGNVTIDGDITSNASIESAIGIDSGKSLSISADNVDGEVANAGTLNLGTGTLAQAISGAGTTNIKGAVTSTASIANAINIDSGKSLTIDADNVDGAVTNAGTLNLGAGTLAQAITGTGTITTTGNVASNASNLGNAVTNTGHTLTLTGGTLNKTVTGGNITIAGDVNSNASIESAIAINATKSLSINANNVGGAVTNAGTLNLGTGTLAQNVAGAGTTNINDGIVIAKGNFTQSKLNLESAEFSANKNLNVDNLSMTDSTLGLQNGSTGVLNVNTLALAGNNHLTLDADLANETMDQLNVTSVSGDGNIVISDIRLLTPTTKDKISLDLFADENAKTALASKVTGNLTGLEYSPIYKYDALYDKTTGKIGFTRYNSGTSDDFNPYIYAPSGVANTTAAMTTQIATLAMDKMDDVVHAQGRSGGDTPTSSNVWVKVMGLNDNVEFKNFENIDSKALTVAAGYNTDKISCGDCGIVFGAYAGYIGGKQHYTANDIDQDGGYVGLSSALTLGDAFLTATVNGGLLKNKANNMYGSDRFDTLWLGAGIKTGYNYALTDSVVLQPNVYGGYTLVNTKDYTSVSGVKIATNNLNFFEIDPGLKLSAVIADGWTGSVQGKYAIVMDNGADITANDFALQNISTKNYIEYGIGIDKSVTDAFYLGAKVNRHDGGRTGWNGSIEFRYKF